MIQYICLRNQTIRMHLLRHQTKLILINLLDCYASLQPLHVSLLNHFHLMTEMAASIQIK